MDEWISGIEFFAIWSNFDDPKNIGKNYLFFRKKRFFWKYGCSTILRGQKLSAVYFLTVK